jgi:hypothetical protein
LADHLDYSEPATLLTYSRDTVLPGKTRITTLADAVRTIVETWEGEQLTDVFIATPSGAIEDLDAVRAIYDRPDFPEDASQRGY